MELTTDIEPLPSHEFNYDGKGSYTAKVMAGTYYVRGMGFDPVSGKSYRAERVRK